MQTVLRTIASGKCTRHRFCFVRTMSTTSSRPVEPVATDDYVAGSVSIAYVTINDEAGAKKLARSLLEARLAACVNIVPRITSIYRWDGAVQEDAEAMLLVKTLTARVPDVCAHVRANHPYGVAEVIAVPVAQGNSPYMAFVQQAMKE